jgi:hypothetical protein
VTGSRPSTALAALLITLAVVSSAAGVLLLVGGDPVAVTADAGQLPMEVAESSTATAARGSAGRWSAASKTATRTFPARRPAPPRPQPAAPVRLIVDAAHMNVPVVPVGARDQGELTIPDQPRTVGWWVGSAPAGSRHGSSLLAGHVDSSRSGLGAFAVLRTLPLGPRVVLADVFGGRHVYEVAARRSYSKYDLPADVIRGGSRPRLTMVTCGGPFDEDRRSYRDNVVVYAMPA